MSISTILVVVGILIMLVGGLVVAISALRRRASDQAILKSVVKIQPSDDSTVEWTPDIDENTIRKMKLAVLYLAKIGFVLRDGDEDVKDMFSQLLESLIADGELEEDDYFFNQLSHITTVIGASNSDNFYSATDVFVIELIEGVTGDHIVNDLPRPGLAVNIPVSVFLVLDDVASALVSDTNRMVFRSVVRKTITEMSNFERFTIKDLRLITGFIDGAFREFSGILKND